MAQQQGSENKINNDIIDSDDDDDEYDPSDDEIFVDTLKAKLYRCPICLSICKDPIETEPCGHLYCKACIEEHLGIESVSNVNAFDLTSKNCPTCRSKIDSILQSKFLLRQLLQLRMTCKNKDKGCKWKGELRYYTNHRRNTCQYTILKCQYCKNSKFERINKQKHEDICELYPILCKLCNKYIERKKYQKHINSECPNILMDCTSNCGQKIKKCLMKQHLNNICKHRDIKCPYYGYGCNKIIKYHDKMKHINDNKINHLELKVMYLQRLSESSKIISVNNITGKWSEINGLYERQIIPHNGRPLYIHKNVKHYYIRFDANLKAYVMDMNKCNGNIVAIRKGIFSHPCSNDEELDILLENMDELKNGDEEKLDKHWHIYHNNRLSISVSGYSQREWDLEFELKSLKAEFRKSFVKNKLQMFQQAISNRNNNNENIAIACKCGKALEKISSSKVYDNENKKKGVPANVLPTFSVLCDVCEIRIKDGTTYYHCPANYAEAHPQGYDLCTDCAMARLNTQDIIFDTVYCICSQIMNPMLSKTVYPSHTPPLCNECGKTCGMNCFHCPKYKNKYHATGFDYCIKCASKIGSRNNPNNNNNASWAFWKKN